MQLTLRWPWMLRSEHERICLEHTRELALLLERRRESERQSTAIAEAHRERALAHQADLQRAIRLSQDHLEHLEKVQRFNRALVKQIVTLKRDGFSATRARPERQVIPSQPTLEEIGERGATEELIQHMAEDFRRNGVEEQMALKEARRLAKAIEPGFIGVNE